MKNLLAYNVPLKIISAASLDNADNTVSYLRVLEKCYIFLLKFVRNNNLTQSVMLPKIDDFFKDFDYGVHAWELIAEIFRNTDQLVTYNLVPLLKRALRNIAALELETHKKTIQLSFVNYFIFNKGEALPENQCLICAEVTQRDGLNHLFTGAKIEKLNEYMGEMLISYSDFMSDPRFLQEIPIPPELCYTIEYLKLLANCGVGYNSTTEAIASEQFPLEDGIENLKIADFCYPYKTSLLIFIDSIYLDIEKETSDENVIRIKTVIEIIRQDLEAYIGVQQRVAANKGGGAKRLAVAAPTDEENEQMDIKVDINKNFNMQTAFGSFPISQHMDEYVFEAAFPSLTHFFPKRYPIKPEEKE